ncbi:hypothetical protein GCM10025767_25720 [Thalassotalea piscium]
MKIFITLLAIISTISCIARAELKHNSNTFILNNINIIDVKNRKVQRDKSILISEGKIKKNCPFADTRLAKRHHSHRWQWWVYNAGPY